MSFLDDVLDLAGSAVSWFTGNTTGAQLARTALTGYALSQVTSSINKENERPQTATTATVDPGVRLQFDPDPNAKIPVVYGRANLGGIITDAQLTNNNGTMFYCITLCERTGIKLSDSAQSSFTFRNIYWDDCALKFASDGITVSSWVDREGTVNTDVAGKIRVYCYNGNSDSGVVPYPYSGTVPAAYSVMPGWTSSHDMSDLIFAIVRVDYSASANIKGLGELKFDLENSMTQPGDCLYDYMTNTRYGAGIAATEIYAS